MGAAARRSPTPSNKRVLPWWATQRRPPRKREHIEIATEEVAGRVLSLPAVYGPSGERKTKMYNGRVLIFTRLVELLLKQQGGWLKLPASDLAHECNTCLRTVRYAIQEFRDRRLIVTVETPNIQGGKGPLSIHLHPSIRPIFFPPKPEDVAPLNSTTEREELTTGCAHAREGEAPRKRRPAARDLNNILGALRAPLTASLSDADRRVLVHVENSLQKPPYERWVPLYRDLLLQAVSLPMRPRLKAPGGWVRAELARAMQLAGARPPETWLLPRCSHRQLVGRCEHGCEVGVPPVKLLTEAELVRMRLGAGADRLRVERPPPAPKRRGAEDLSPPDATSTLARMLGIGAKSVREVADRLRAEHEAAREARLSEKARGITGARTRRRSDNPSPGGEHG